MRTWYDAPTGDTNAVIEQFAQALGDDAHGVIRRMKDPRFAARIAGFAREGATPLTLVQERAREIMGDSMYSLGQVFLHLGIEPTRRQRDYLSDLRTPDGRLITDEELRTRDVYTFLVPVLPYSIIDMYNKVFPLVWPSIRPLKRGDHLLGEPFAKEKGQPGWMLLQPLYEETMDARTLCYLVLLRYFATGDLLYRGREYIVGDTSKDGNAIRMQFEKESISIWFNLPSREKKGYRML